MNNLKRIKSEKPELATTDREGNYDLDGASLRDGTVYIASDKSKKCSLPVQTEPSKKMGQRQDESRKASRVEDTKKQTMRFQLSRQFEAEKPTQSQFRSKIFNQVLWGQRDIKLKITGDFFAANQALCWLLVPTTVNF